MDIVGRDIDLQRIRKDYKVTQQRLAELTKYPQSFISQVENHRVSTPAAFLKVLMEVLDISNLEPYYCPTPEEGKAQSLNKETDENVKTLQTTITRLFDLLERRDERIRELENEITRLHEIMLKNQEK